MGPALAASLLQQPMATSNGKRMSGTAERKARDSEVWEYLYVGDSIPDNSLQAINLAHTTGPDPVPVVGSQLADRFIFVQTINADQTEERRDSFKITVNFGPPEPGEDEDQQMQPNPLARPAVYDIQYIESEKVVHKARNRVELTDGFTRAVGTLGPIVNAAYRRPDEPIVDTERNTVFVIERNYATLGEIAALNEDYQRTCNNDTCTIGGRTIGPNRLKYLVTRSLGKQQEGDVEYYRGATEIELKRTTDLVIDNVGYDYWDPVKSDYFRAQDADGNDTADPVNLDLSGELLSTGTTQLTYYHLEEVAYAGFFS